MTPYRIWTNHLFTRRKSFFYVTDTEENIVFRDRWFWPCVEYLDTIDVEAYEIVPSNRQELHVKRVYARTKD